MRGRYLLALSVVLSVLLAPSLAFADDGFVGGLQDLVGTREVEQQEVTPEESFAESYEPVLMETETVRADDGETEEGGLVSSADMTGVLNAAYRVPMGAGYYGLLTAVPRLFTVYGVAGIAVTFVFLWWGVRKALKMIMAAFRKGRASV